MHALIGLGRQRGHSHRVVQNEASWGRHCVPAPIRMSSHLRRSTALPPASESERRRSGGK